MTPELAMDIGRSAALAALWIAAPMLGAGLVAGLAAGVLQAATQIQEQTLSFVVKTLATTGAIWAAGGWMLDHAIEVFGWLGRLSLVAPR